MSVIQRHFEAYWHSRTAEFRLAAGLRASDELMRSVLHQLRTEASLGMPDDLKLRFAERLYGNDPRAARLLSLAR
jgi:hypothetical protein